MKKMMMMLLILTLVAGALIACGGNGDQVKKPESLELTSADNGKAIEVAIGSDIKLTLAENQTTPVHWQDKPEQVGDAVISEVTSEYVTDPNPDGRMGVRGKRIFSFKVNTAGTVKLAFKATHISDPNDVYETYEVTLTSK